MKVPYVLYMQKCKIMMKQSTRNRLELIVRLISHQLTFEDLTYLYFKIAIKYFSRLYEILGDSGEYRSLVADERKNSAKNNFILDFFQIWRTGIRYI